MSTVGLALTPQVCNPHFLLPSWNSKFSMWKTLLSPSENVLSQLDFPLRELYLPTQQILVHSTHICAYSGPGMRNTVVSGADMGPQDVRLEP